MVIFKIKGIVREKESGFPLPGLFIKAYDKDLLFSDLLGSAVSNKRGEFDIVSELEDFREFFDVRPDIYFMVYRGDRRTLVHSTEDAVRWRAGRIAEFEIRIPGSRFHEGAETEVVLVGDDGAPREEFEVGESLAIQARGLRPAHAYDIGVYLEGKELFTSRLITNLQGELEPTVLWPQVGFDDPNGDARFTPGEAQKRWTGKALTLVVASGNTRIAEQTVRIARALTHPLVLATDREGRLLNSFEAGTQPLHLTLLNLPFSGRARIYLVPRQHDWREGDPFQPASLRDGRPAVHEVDLPEKGAQAVIELAAKHALLPGAYDFIVRPLRYGYEETDAFRVLAEDVVGSRRLTGVVIREDFWKAKPVLGGCVNRIPLSGRSVAGAPYFQYADTFQVGENIHAALDPGIVDPGNIGKMCALYVIPSKDDTAWNADNSLGHLAILGGNAAVQKIKVQAGCVNFNKILVWPGAMQPGVYDIVADFGNNTSDASAFVPDNAYDTPLDIIDGYFTAGFRVTEDPGTLVEFSTVGNWNYDENVVSGMGLPGTPGTVTVQDENTSYFAPGGFSTINTSVPLRAHVYFPADPAHPNQTDPAQADYPLVCVIHGNGHDYANYDLLLQHLAKNGFISASIHLANNMRALGRANVFFRHLLVLQAHFGATLRNSIGVMGHSRGGEAVLKVARLNEEQALGHGISALISLAPTDQYGSEAMAGAWAKPYFVLYGSRDGDIDGDIWTPGYTVPQTGFALYDRTNGVTKTMAFVYRATHNGFITTNHDAEAGDVPNLLPPATQQAVTMAYMNAFFRQYLRNESKWEGMFTGEWKPASVAATGAEIYLQHQNSTHKTVDDFEGAISDWQSSTIGGTVSHDDPSANPTLPEDPLEERCHAFDPLIHPYLPAGLSPVAGLDPKSPHDTEGLRLRWDNLGDHLAFSIPPADKDVSGYSVLSFRVTQKIDSPHNAANQDQNFRVALKDSSNNERAVRVSAFAKIPFPDHRSTHTWSKSALSTVRIPLTAYTIVCAGQPKVDLQNVVSLAFIFSEKATGEIEIDNIEFSS